MIQGARRQRLEALDPPKLPEDLFVLDEEQGIDIEPYPSWTDPPPGSVRPSWPPVLRPSWAA